MIYKSSFSISLSRELGRSLQSITRDTEELSRFVALNIYNCKTYSEKISQIIVSISMLMEEVWREIIINNNPGANPKNLCIKDFMKVRILEIEDSSGLTWQFDLRDMEVTFDLFDPINKTRFKPFENFGMSNPISPSWYKVYNSIKHNRSKSIFDANIMILIEAYSSVCVLFHCSKVLSGTDVMGAHGLLIEFSRILGSFRSPCSRTNLVYI